MTDSRSEVQVWDISTRVFHWLIVCLFLFQWFSMEFMDDWMEYHEIAGYAFLTLLIFRILWGFVGPEIVRFRHFLYSPKAIIRYCKSLPDREAEPHASHNPLGGISVIILLLLLVIQTISGLFMTDDILFYGPYFSAVSDETQKLMSTLHHLTFDILVWLIAIHIIAVIFYITYKKQPLLKAMISGKKLVKGTTPDSGNRWLLAGVILLISIAIVYGLVDYFAPETIDYF